LGRSISEDPARDPNNPNLYTYARNNPLRFFNPTGLISLADIGLSSATTGLSSKELNEIQIDKPNSSAPKPPNEQFLKYEYMFGEVSFETILAHGFLPWELMDEDEKALMKEYYITFEVLYQSGTITKEQYEKEMTRIESQGGKPVKGYWHESIYGNITPTNDEAYLAAGVAAIRTVQIFGPVVASSPFFQKLGSDIPDVKHPTPAGKRYVMEVCKSGVIRYRDTVTGRFVMDPFKKCSCWPK